MAKQKLSGRDTYTPTDVSQVRSNCDVSLNSPLGVMDSVTHLKTPDNNSDANLTASGHAGRDLRVPVIYVRNMRGEPLMPTTPRKAKKMLRSGKAKVVTRTPFTVQLLHSTGETVQPVSLGVDPGYKHVGLSAVRNTGEKSEKVLHSADVELRDDIVRLLSEKRMYRRNRRSRLWYRKPRFLNRAKPKGWLAPSVQHKLNSHIKVIENVKKILPINSITVEVANFDIQKIKNPEINGIDYQEGEQLNFWNVREYVLYRDNHTCQHCKGKSKDPILQVHHMVSRKTGGDRPDNLLTLCKTCHDAYHAGDITLTAKPKKGYKAETFMTTVRWKIIDRLKEINDCKVNHTYGYLTKSKRIELGLPKSHINDAFVIAGGSTQFITTNEYLVKQVRSCNRKLFRGARSHIKNTSAQPICGYNRYDKVLWNDVECFIFGRRQTGYFDIRKLDGTKIHASAKVKDLTLLECANTLVVERGVLLLPTLTDGVSEA